jgi:hypothetical protein
MPSSTQHAPRSVGGSTSGFAAWNSSSSSRGFESASQHPPTPELTADTAVSAGVSLPSGSPALAALTHTIAAAIANTRFTVIITLVLIILLFSTCFLYIITLLLKWRMSTALTIMKTLIIYLLLMFFLFSYFLLVFSVNFMINIANLKFIFSSILDGVDCYEIWYKEEFGREELLFYVLGSRVA